jgi:hypothetical protein
MTPISYGIQTAFWHSSKPAAGRRASEGHRQQQHPGHQHQHQHQQHHHHHHSLPTSPEDYTFLTLDADRDGSDHGSAAAGSDDGEVTINLSGGFLNSTFQGEIEEDYFADRSDEVKQSQLNDIIQAEENNENILSNSASLTKSLLDDDANADSQGYSSMSSSSSSITNTRSTLSSLYWKQKLIQKHMKRRFLSAEWWEYNYRQKVKKL